MLLSDVWRTALKLKDRHAAAATSVAADLADRCFDEGDLDGFREWNRVRHALVELNRRSP